MIDKDTLVELQKADAIAKAGSAIKYAMDMESPVALPTDMELHDLEDYAPNRYRLAGSLNTTRLTDFVSYCRENAEDGAKVLVNAEHMQATALLNFGDKTCPGHADNRATLKYRQTPAYAALLKMNSSTPAQRELAEWLEDWRDHLQCWAEHEEIDLPLAVAAVRNVTIEALNKAETTVEQLGASRSEFESIKATSKQTLPTIITFTCKPYTELPERTFRLRLHIHTAERAPRITLRIINLPQHEDDMATEVVDQITAAFAQHDQVQGAQLAALPVLVGSYTKL